MISINIPSKYSSQILELAGYDVHSQGSNVGGYVKDISDEGKDKRWHAYPKTHVIELHLDETHNGFHRVVPRYHMENAEKRRILEIFRRQYPEHGVNYRAHDVLAPNLDNLQKMANSLNP